MQDLILKIHKPKEFYGFLPLVYWKVGHGVGHLGYHSLDKASKGFKFR
jgi:hypothetical protein